MAYKTPEKEVPWCTVGLVVACLICHLLVLDGNLKTGESIGIVGKSAKGWADVGLSLADSFNEEIDDTMSNLTEGLTQAINMTAQLQEMLDIIIGVMGDQTDNALLQVSMLHLRQDPGEGETLINATNTTNSTKNSSVAAAASTAIDQIDNFPVALPPGMANVAKIVAGAAAAAGESSGDDPIEVIKAVLNLLIDAMMSQVTDVLDEFLDMIEPVMLQVGKWYATFGDKIQAGIEQFGTAVDIVEKLMDQIMAQSGAGGEQADEMVYNTYNLFAVTDQERGITVQDLSDVSGIYSITALQGSKAEDLHEKYDVNQDAVVDKEEYALFSLDPSLPGVMAVVLRSYAKMLAQVSGQVGGAKLRDEVARGVVKYLQLVCAKNRTKVEWISERLTNGSLPVKFTASVMRNLALLADDPEVLTTTDVGSLVISTMANINHEATIEAADLMANATWWDEEGFDPADQATCVQRVTTWTATTLIQIGSIHPERAAAALVELHQRIGGKQADKMALLQGGMKSADALGSLARRKAEESLRVFHSEKRVRLVQRYEALTSSRFSRYYYDVLLGGQMASHEDPNLANLVKTGTPAVPETLEFARFLSWNASRDAAQWQSLCFNYSGMSSTPADAIATQIQGMVKKVQGFMSMLDDYAGEDGMERLRNKTLGFIESAKNELLDVILEQFDMNIDLRREFGSESFGSALTLMEVSQKQPAPGSGAWLQMIVMLQQLQAVLPPCIESLKSAREQVAKVTKTIDSAFQTFHDQAPPIFETLALYYKLSFLGYFLLMIIFPLTLLYYAFYAGGYCGGPKADEIEDYEEPVGCWARICACCSCCGTCIRDCWRGEFCFWSFLILGQLFIVVLFLLSMVFCILAGVEMFIASGCAQIYLLGNESICTETLRVVQRFVMTFDARAPHLKIGQVCGSKDLMVCHHISNRLKNAAIYSASGAILAGFISFYLLIEACVIHERVRMKRIIDSLVKQQDKEKAAAAGASSTA
eukprot:TRINITY_DN1266_c0_g1_i1.p1 TRINITY_DN1266_c0_g1~~TRINITY_DN1266_c0_g1_i1.p1  ORF type:complete len:990 (-),score=220.63 TRINITY_DN1266_c0_g1_i1:81-3050(-)